MRVYTYENASGKDLIKKYIDKLSKEEQVDGYSVLQAFEENRLDELNIKPWQGSVTGLELSLPDNLNFKNLSVCRF